jgi:alanine-synthesizing transaminase
MPSPNSLQSSLRMGKAEKVCDQQVGAQHATPAHHGESVASQMFAKRTNWNLATNRLSEALVAHRAAGKPLIDLTLSNPTECGFEYENEAILRALQNPAALKYEPNPRGLDVARNAVQKYYAEDAVGRGSHIGGFEEGNCASVAGTSAAVSNIHLDDIFLTTSTSEAYSYVFRTLCDAQDEVLIPEPSYPLFDFLADIQDVRLVRYPLLYDHGWQIDFHSLEQSITPRTRGVIVVNPNNPTGNYCKPNEMRQLSEICLAQDLAIIADEVFLDFSLRPEKGAGGTEEQPASFAGSEEALTFTMSGLSKICGLPQMKAAWVIVSGPHNLKTQAAARLEVIADTYLSMNAPIQLALPALLELRHGFQKQLLARTQANLAELDRQLRAQESVSRLKVEGGWNAVLRVPATRPDEGLALGLLSKAGVYAHPGHFYDFHKEGYLVVSLITPEKEFSQGIKRLLEIEL